MFTYLAKLNILNKEGPIVLSSDDIFVTSFVHLNHGTYLFSLCNATKLVRWSIL